MLVGILLILAASAVLSLLMLLILFLLGKCPDANAGEDIDAQYYDEAGNHLYYDRKLIARLKREQASEKK